MKLKSLDRIHRTDPLENIASNIYHKANYAICLNADSRATNVTPATDSADATGAGSSSPDSIETLGRLCVTSSYDSDTLHSLSPESPPSVTIWNVVVTLESGEQKSVVSASTALKVLQLRLLGVRFAPTK